MKQLAALSLVLLAPIAPAQAAHAPAPHTAKAATPAVLPFSGSWILSRKRTKLQSEHIPDGESKAVITYDGKTWHYVHTHLDSDDALPDSWQITLVVGSPKLHAEPGEGFEFHSRISRAPDGLMLNEYGVSPNGQKIHNAIHYTLEDDNNTLVQEERSKGPLGTTVNRWVLEREGTGETGSKGFGGHNGQ